MALAVDFLRKVNQEKFAPSFEETERRLDCVVEKTEELAKMKRKKVPLEWDIWSPQMKKTVNQYIKDVEDQIHKSDQRPFPVDYKKEI